MEHGDRIVPRITRKRKSCEDETSIFPLNELNQDLLEKVLSWLPTSPFFRLTTVCKKWKSVAESATFGIACSQVSSRDPWFLMVDSHQPHHLAHQPIIFDSSEKNWKKLNPLPVKKQSIDACSNFIPVASSGGLVCFHNPSGELFISNPITGSGHRVASLDPVAQQPIQAIAMLSNSETFRLVLVTGELSNLKFKHYDSSTNKWEQEIPLTRRINNRIESVSVSKPEYEYDIIEEDDDSTQYFLTKCGDVVSTGVQRSPCKQFSSLLTIKDNDEMLYFLSSSGTIVSCNLTQKLFFEYPRLMPIYFEYSIDIVELHGQMHMVLLSEFFESTSLRVWGWDENDQSWNQIAAMPPWMSQKFYGKKVDINCSGVGDQMLVCLNSGEICSYFVCNVSTNEWVELPHCDMNGEAREFACAFSFEPRVEAAICGSKRIDLEWIR